MDDSDQKQALVFFNFSEIGANLAKNEKLTIHFCSFYYISCVLMKKFELIPTSIFQVMAILRNAQNLNKSLYYSPWIFPKMAPKSPKNFITFSYTY